MDLLSLCTNRTGKVPKNSALSPGTGGPFRKYQSACVPWGACNPVGAFRIYLRKSNPSNLPFRRKTYRQS